MRFVDARKHWTVDYGRVAAESHMYPMFVDGVVPYESRDRNVTRYGLSSHKDVVNKYVRTPMIAPVDLSPLSHKPYETTPWRINPALFDTPVAVDDGWKTNTFTGLKKFRIDRPTRNF
jgi:hypothetical protein